MTRWLSVVLIGMGVAGWGVIACSSKNKSDGKGADSTASPSPSGSTAKASRRPPTSAFLDVLGEDGLGSLGMLDGPNRESALFGRVAIPHTPNEPAVFSAEWVGVEAADVLKRAKAKDLEQASVSTSTRDCLIFHEGGMVRRLMTNFSDESHEFAMSQAGNVIIFLRAARDQHQSRQLAFFHQGRDLKLFQAWEGSGRRRNENAPSGFREYVFDEAKDCFNAFHAKNPTPGVGAVAPAPPPPPPPPPPPATTENSYTFKVDSVSFKPKDSIRVAMSAPLAAPPDNKFWITIVPADAPDSEFGAWHYVASGADVETLVAPTPGEYEIRLHDAFPMHKYRVMARQRISVVAAAPTPPPETTGECANAGAPGTFCTLPSGLRGYCDLTTGMCGEQCPDGMGLSPDGQCYPTCPSNGFCGDECSCQWGVCVCPPGD